MKIQFASGMHLSLRAVGSAGQGNRTCAGLAGACGGIHRGTQAVEIFADWPVQVVYLLGNSEFHEHGSEQTRADVRNACAGGRTGLIDYRLIQTRPDRNVPPYSAI